MRSHSFRHPLYGIAVILGTLAGLAIGVGTGTNSPISVLYALTAFISLVMMETIHPDGQPRPLPRLPGLLGWVGEPLVMFPTGVLLAGAASHIWPELSRVLIVVVGSFYVSGLIHRHVLGVEGDFNARRDLRFRGRRFVLGLGHVYIILGIAIAFSAWAGGPGVQWFEKDVLMDVRSQWFGNFLIGATLGALVGLDAYERYRKTKVGHPSQRR